MAAKGTVRFRVVVKRCGLCGAAAFSTPPPIAVVFERPGGGSVLLYGALNLRRLSVVEALSRRGVPVFAVDNIFGDELAAELHRAAVVIAPGIYIGEQWHNLTTPSPPSPPSSIELAMRACLLSVLRLPSYSPKETKSPKPVVKTCALRLPPRPRHCRATATPLPRHCHATATPLPRHCHCP